MKATLKDITAVMLDAEHCFEIDGRVIRLYPQTLGVAHMTASMMEGMGIRRDIMEHNATLECLRLAHRERAKVAMVVAVHAVRAARDEAAVREVARYIERKCSLSELATLFMLVLRTNRVSEYMDALGITDEHKRMEKVKKAKTNDNTYVFGGKSLYGALISAACEKYGWTYDYVMWGISYDNLQLMLADSVTTIYLSDEEKKQGGVASPGSRTMKVTAENLAKIAEMFNQRSGGRK